MNAVAELWLIKRHSKPAISCSVPCNMLNMDTGRPPEAANYNSKGSQVSSLSGNCTNKQNKKINYHAPYVCNKKDI